MKHTKESLEAFPQKSLDECVQGLDDLADKLDGVAPQAIRIVKHLLNTMQIPIDESATIKAEILCKQARENRTAARFEAILGRNDMESTAERDLMAGMSIWITERQNMEKAADIPPISLRTSIAEWVLAAMEVLLDILPTGSGYSSQPELYRVTTKLNASEARASAATKAMEKNTEDIGSRHAALERSFAEKEKALEDSLRELKKCHHKDLRELVEPRVREEKAQLAKAEVQIREDKAKLVERLSKAEAKALQHARVLEEKGVLEAKIIQESREKALLKQSKLELEQRYRERDEEAKALREGYDQLSKDNQALQTEKAVLQADYDELKEHERISTEKISSSKPRHSDQPTASSPHISSTTAFDRQTAELHHLDGLVAIWQTALDNSNAEIHDSRIRKAALEEKIREAEQQLKELKPAPASKTHRASNNKTDRRKARKKEQDVLDGAAAGQEVFQSSVNPPGTVPKARMTAEAFPALSAPAVPKTTASNGWKSLRLVDIPKEETMGARKKSG